MMELYEKSNESSGSVEYKLQRETDIITIWYKMQYQAMADTIFCKVHIERAMWIFKQWISNRHFFLHILSNSEVIVSNVIG